MLKMNDNQLENIRKTLIKEREERRSIELKHEIQTAEFNAVFQNLADAYLMMDLSGRVLKMNDPAKEILGFDLDVEKFNLMQIAVPNELQNIIESFSILTSEGVLRNFKSFIKTKSGELKYVNVNASIIYDDNKNPKAAQGIVRDITDIYEEKKKLEESQERLYTLVNNKVNGILLENENRKILSVNEKFCAFFNINVEPELLKGQDCSNAAEENKHLVHNPEKFVERINSIVEKREVVIGDELLMKNGQILSRDFTPIFIDEKYKGHLWSYTDITLNKSFDKGIKAERYKYESLINNTNLGLIETDAEGRIITVNKMLQKMYGSREEDLVGNKIIDLYPNKTIISLINNIEKDLSEAKPKSYEFPVKTKFGKIRYWMLNVVPNYNINGELVSYVGAHIDITNVKKLELEKDSLVKRLRKTNDDLQDYVHMVSHDLKTPLRNINALTNWLNEDYGSKIDEKGVETLNLIQSAVEKMEKMISGILEYSSLDSEKVEMYDIDINSLFNEIFSTLKIPQHISLTINNELPVIKGDKFRLNLLFNNLLNNAIVNIDKNEGIIQISCLDGGSHWKFCVRDNGKGIEKGYLEKIFRVFQKLDNKNNSTGIGLSIVKKIVEIYDGSVFAESDPGKGTEIYFTLKKF